MNRQQLDIAVPMLYALLIVVTVFFFEGAIASVAVIGAMLMGLYYSVRARGNVGGGRGRNRSRGRNR